MPEPVLVLLIDLQKSVAESARAQTDNTGQGQGIVGIRAWVHASDQQPREERR